MCTCLCRCPQRQEESIGHPAARVPGSCELASVGAEQVDIFQVWRVARWLTALPALAEDLSLVCSTTTAPL